MFDPRLQQRPQALPPGVLQQQSFSAPVAEKDRLDEEVNAWMVDIFRDGAKVIDRSFHVDGGQIVQIFIAHVPFPEGRGQS